MARFIVSTSHGSFHVTESSAAAAKTFALRRLEERHAGETIVVFAVTKAA